MPMPPSVAQFFASAIGRVVMVLVALALAWWIVHALTSGKGAKVEAELNQNRASAAIESGADAVGSVGAQGAREGEIDATTRRNEDAIRNAEGAGAPVADPARDAGLRSLCQRAAYRGSEQCVSYTSAP